MTQSDVEQQSVDRPGVAPQRAFDRRRLFGPGLRRGFTLVELMIVLAIVAVIAAIAIPNLLEARRLANETSAISYMRTWITAQEYYHSQNGEYATADEDLGNAGLISRVGDHDGYTFSLDNPTSQSQYRWWGHGSPVTPGRTGVRHFYLDQSGVVRFNMTEQADENDPPIGE